MSSTAPSNQPLFGGQVGGLSANDLYLSGDNQGIDPNWHWSKFQPLYIDNTSPYLRYPGTFPLSGGTLHGYIRRIPPFVEELTFSSGL